MTCGDSSPPQPSRAPIRERPDVVVTGIGAVSGYGWSAHDLERGLRAGPCIGSPRRFDVSGHRTALVAEVPAAPEQVRQRLGEAAGGSGGVRSSRADRFALAAAHEALAQAGLEAEGDWSGRAGVFFSGSTAGMAEAERYFFALLDDPSSRPRLRLTRGHTLNCPGDAVARRFAVRGRVLTISSACSSGSLAFVSALRCLRRGEVDVALVGGADGLCQLTYAGFNALRAVDERPCRPFRATRSGLSLGEGAAVLVLERVEDAERRGATPRARLLGAAGSCDAHHMTAPEPGGEGAAAAIRAALADAGREPEGVDFVNAHGTGTQHNDIAEWRALESVFGPAAATLPVTSTKSGLGHLLGAAGAIEAVATILCLARGELHPTWGAGPVDDEIGVDLVREQPREIPRGGCAVSTNLAFGGANAAVVLAGATESA
ncbi:MAG: beta-ketoacyl-[acyl-carrier-protein] synthase family protein [Acidobacteria bacterium]|nr:MAG: beta-ketoacyl-[acyl-carrier-protein] synthase family protein [Acidobacteriota bacterium]REK07106.1 MAG: beta-ketoacyl-[acyl-carrier-protein] synthase family protein [Acidobacteriota bacterium]